MAIPPGQETSHPSAAEIREYLLSELNESLRRPGMYGGELALHLYLDAVAFAHGLPHFMRDEIASLQRAQVFLSTGVRGGFEVFWGRSSDDMISSVYLEVARRRGWLRPDLVMPEADYLKLAGATSSWCAEDRGFGETVGMFGPACFGSMRYNPRFPITLTYVPETPDLPCLSFHFWNEVGKDGGTKYPESSLLGIRRESDDFAGGLTLSPLGRRYRDERLDADRRA